MIPTDLEGQSFGCGCDYSEVNRWVIIGISRAPIKALHFSELNSMLFFGVSGVEYLQGCGAQS